MFDDLLKQNQSIMDAYKKMHALKESESTGGDGSAYNKYVLAKTGDLPTDPEAYKSAGVEEGLLDKAKEVGKKVLDTVGHGDDESLLADLKSKVDGEKKPSLMQAAKKVGSKILDTLGHEDDAEMTKKFAAKIGAKG